MQKLFWIRNFSIFLFVAYGFGYVEQTFLRQKDKIAVPVLYLSWFIQFVSLVCLILTKVISMEAVIPLIWIDQIRLYVGLFQINRILITAENKFSLSFNMLNSVLLIGFQIVFISRVIFKDYKEKTKLMYYVFNIMLLFFGLIHKLIGFEKAKEMGRFIIIKFILTSIGLAVVCCALHTIEKCEEKELKYD